MTREVVTYNTSYLNHKRALSLFPTRLLALEAICGNVGDIVDLEIVSCHVDLLSQELLGRCSGGRHQRSTLESL